MSYVRQTWNNGDVITKDKLNHIEEGIENVELTPGPKGDTGAQGPKGEKGDTGAQGPKGADATIPKLNKIDSLATEADASAIVTAFNNLIADLKSKKYMNEA